MSERILSTDPLTGITQYFDYDDRGSELRDEIILRTEQDVTPIVEANRELHKNANGRFKGEMHRVASIPLVVLQELAKQGIITMAGRVLDQARFKKWLNDPDNRAFRTRAGRI